MSHLLNVPKKGVARPMIEIDMMEGDCDEIKLDDNVNVPSKIQHNTLYDA